MYLVQMFLNDDVFPERGSFNKTIKIEKLQGFDIQQLRKSEGQEPEWCYSVTFIPEKGGTFEDNLYYHKSPHSLGNDEIIAMGIYATPEEALRVVDFFESYSGYSINLNDYAAFNSGYFIFKSFDI